MWPGAHERLASLGMPEDRIDYVLSVWKKSAWEEAFEEKEQSLAPLVAAASAGDSIEDPCARFVGDELRGCRVCTHRFPGRLDECLPCGRQCFAKLCPDGATEGCVAAPDFLSCHEECMAYREPMVV